VVLARISDGLFPVTLDALYTLFSFYGTVQKARVCDKRKEKTGGGGGDVCMCECVWFGIYIYVCVLGHLGVRTCIVYRV
jgi:hypothetical protein